MNYFVWLAYIKLLYGENGCFFFLGVEKHTNTKHKAHVVRLGVWFLQNYLKLEFGTREILT